MQAQIGKGLFQVGPNGLLADEHLNGQTEVFVEGGKCMREIELWTSDGHFVAVVDIAPFPDRGMPKVVMWGDRVFVDAATIWGDRVFPETREPSDRWRYAEAFAVISLTESPGRPLDPPKPVPPVDRSARCTVGEALAPGVPNTENRGDGQQKGYVVLCDAERARGFVRPVRRAYRHLKCGSTTTMGQKLAETYARDPGFYSGTFCCTCGGHYPVGASGEFVWDGTDEKVGT